MGSSECDRDRNEKTIRDGELLDLPEGDNTKQLSLEGIQEELKKIFPHGYILSFKDPLQQYHTLMDFPSEDQGFQNLAEDLHEIGQVQEGKDSEHQEGTGEVKKNLHNSSGTSSTSELAGPNQ